MEELEKSGEEEGEDFANTEVICIPSECPSCGTPGMIKMLLIILRQVFMKRLVHRLVYSICLLLVLFRLNNIVIQTNTKSCPLDITSVTITMFNIFYFFRRCFYGENRVC